MNQSVKIKGLSFVKMILGSLFLALIAQFAFPLSFTTIPITPQTLGISILAGVLSPKEAFCAVLLYLLQASFGLSVFGGGKSDPAWLFSSKAGYLLGFLFSSYLVSSLLIQYRPKYFLKSWLIFAVNESVVLITGTVWLSYSIGLEKGFTKGMLPFFPGALVKITIAALLFKTARSCIKLKESYNEC